MHQYQNILIIKMSALGDVIHALPCAVALRELYPKARITWLVHPQFGALLPEEPILDEVIYFDKVEFNRLALPGKIKKLWQLRQYLHAQKFDLAIDLQGLFKSAVVAALSGANRKIGYNYMREGSSLISKPIHGQHDNGHVVQQYLDVIRYLGSSIEEPVFPKLNLDTELLEINKRVNLEAYGKTWEDTVVLVPGAGWPTKEWPIHHFVELSKRLIEDGKIIILAGGPVEKTKGQAIINGLQKQQAINLIGRTNLRQLAALMSKAKLCIGGDTGPLHVAAAMNCEAIALFGPTKAERNGPYGKHIQIIVSPVPCNYNFRTKEEIKDNCMEKITVDEVYDAARHKLST
ncbi:MAG TPA: glycosyltransferase family 9 protein [Candidatus Avacidaminococcus intestinavium]|uniref:Glycosyltransferase family 9 protein n=1 Tax=Candidatus Avacidaminococcus intestinavium TaxID=2840684 RepID=A0A9D1MNU2_9FIRM|nr:glycosyltransferase family 9 protein [Candidatus Avacidaminococcus intestinavium]